MTAPSDFFTADLSRLISAANTTLPHSNADLRDVEPEMKSIIVGFAADGAPIWRRVPVTRVRINHGWVETRLNDTTEDRDERASAR
jgi:hypothetical protein